MDWESLIPQPPSRRVHRLPRIGIDESFLAAPLICGLDEEPVDLIVEKSTATLAELVSAGELDCALLPFMSYARRGPLIIIPGMAITATAAPTMEQLLTRCDVTRIGRVAFNPLDGDTDVLARVVLGEVYRCSPEFVPLLNQDTEDFDAVVVSGEKAFQSDGDFTGRIDLGKAWLDLTGRPVVHRLWVAHTRAPLGDLRRILFQARRRGEERFEDLIREVETRMGPEAKACIQHSVRYSFGTDDVESVEAFVSLASKRGLCEAGVRLSMC